MPVSWSGRRSDDDCTHTPAWAMPGFYHVYAAALGSTPSDVQFEVTRGPTVRVTKTSEPSPTASPSARARAKASAAAKAKAKATPEQAAQPRRSPARSPSAAATTRRELLTLLALVRGASLLNPRAVHVLALRDVSA